MSSPPWRTINGASLPPDDPTKDSFTITAPPKTDIWRPSDTEDTFNAPTIYQTLPASTFKKIEVTIYAPWATQYDQGGLILAFPRPSPSPSLSPSTTTTTTTTTTPIPTPNPQPQKWIKAGIELFQNTAVLGVVGTDRFSDWSLAPMRQEYHQKARVRLEKSGTTLWVYGAQQEGESEKMRALREIKWAFQEGREDAEVWVGVYAAKPTPEEGEDVEKGIEVSFSDLVIEKEGDEE